MSGQRLKLQFQRLYNHYSGRNTETNLHDISEVLFCTRRNVRMVINKMVDKGWIDWQPAVGRGKQSRLIFNSTDSELQFMQARKLVTDGKLETALSVLDNNAEKLVQLIHEQLGISHVHGRQIVRLPYYRSFGNLNPLKPLRRSEQHLVRQIFSGLTQFNEEKGEVEPDIAHAWEMISVRHWRFHIRPAIRFHDGRLLESDDIIQTFKELKQQALFKHIDDVISPFANTIDVYLKRDDFHLPALLANISAVIQPAKDHRRSDATAFPVGTGPYKVTINDKQRLKLEAFDMYFGFRALTDVVEIWILTGFSACYLKPSLELAQTQSATVSNKLSLDQGCNYLLLNRNKGLAQQKVWLDYFQSRLNSLSIMRHLDLNKVSNFKMINAYGLLPGWVCATDYPHDIVVPTTKRSVTLAYQQEHPIYPYMAELIAEILANDGITLKVIEIAFEEIMQGKQADKIDLWLNGMSLGSDRADAILPWLYNFEQIERAMPPQAFSQLEILIDNWRMNITPEFPLEEIQNLLVNSGQVLPLFHAWLGVDGNGELEGMASNQLGWFDFKSVWVKPRH
ncbi:SgrR family transcriptional regulator [Photobacterium sp. GB-50]|uniref:SgrR family transcriptional regulator n=1 Tax=Photobacterium sp. GB-50 TaxID=2022107 RepID=UPI000D17969D|nr:SgrR family transcriptional regulator [Photobacterium sp. GB-50]PSW73647.1 SgrR family transcriptional regulator [Photobacterium sp. GB-50]